METYHGHIRTQLDAIIIFEACRLGRLPRIRRRLSERERLQIKSGSVYVWDEGEAGMRRWTDGKSWSASRVSGSFLTYREMEGNRRSSPERPGKKRATDDGSDSLKYKAGGLYKQSFSIVTASRLKLHLISYYTKEEIASGRLPQPSTDEQFEDIRIPIHMYPDTTPSGSNLPPAVTTSPLDTPKSAAVSPTPNYDQPPMDAYAPPTSAPPPFSTNPYQMHIPPQMHYYPPQQQQQQPYLTLPQVDTISSGSFVPLPPLHQQNNSPAPPLTKKLRTGSPRSEHPSSIPLPSPPSSISSGSSPSNRNQQQANDHPPEESEDRKAINRLDKNLDL
ncbi:hypothetical protein TRICI_004673 [Trichomonascus ciferrii]|uniref:cAMP-independent regulatory protein pac2 n=1 Tax=Trichomonascus ciferrii TaxID=44093 RepID=A0A642V1R0_9ASCO|nr:hypothetical protein TRICI_004673 [Trichomonascus ciferrii]